MATLDADIKYATSLASRRPIPCQRIYVEIPSGASTVMGISSPIRGMWELINNSVNNNNHEMALGGGCEVFDIISFIVFHEEVPMLHLVPAR